VAARRRKAGLRKRTGKAPEPEHTPARATRHAPDGATVPEPGPGEVPEGLTRHVVDLALTPGTGPPTREELAALARATDPELALGGDLAEMAREASALLETSGVSRTDAYRLPAHAPARLAVEVLDRVERCRKILEASTLSRRDAAELARTFAKAREMRLLAAFKAGWEPATLEGHKTVRRRRDGAQAGGAARAGRIAKANVTVAAVARHYWNKEGCPPRPAARIAQRIAEEGRDPERRSARTLRGIVRDALR